MKNTKLIKHISKDAYSNDGSALVLSLSNEAREKKAKGIKVVDATIGMLLDEDGNLSSFKPTNDALKQLSNLDNRKYTGVRGNISYQNNVLNWLFKDSKNIPNMYTCATCASMGGTGALMLAIRNYVDLNKSVLVPNICWGNYISIAEEANRKCDFYNLFTNNEIDIDNIENTLIKFAKKDKRATIIINDPCHNPTGYSLSIEEWEKLVKIFDKINEKYPLTLILDIAYIDFAKESRNYFKVIEKTKVNYLTLVTFSASKTLSVYGLRLGALVAIGSHDDIEDFKRSSTATSRATWSSPNAHAIATFNKVLGDKNNFKLYEKYRMKHHDLLFKRYERARNYFDKLIKYESALPYIEGFFFVYRVKDAKKIADNLKKKNIYVLPMGDNYIRIAICSLIGF